MDLAKYLLEEQRLHPSLAPQDVVKLCYQAAFGAEHMLSDATQAKAYLLEEYEATPVDDRPLVEYISQAVCRVNLAAWKRLKLNPDWLWNIFLSSVTAEGNDTSGDIFETYITQVDELSKLEEFSFSNAQWREYISAYNVAGCTPIRHSPAYRGNETPAYRVISGQITKLIPIFEAMPGREGGVIAIDGRAAAGKSTLAGNLSKVINAGTIAMDDFFLPPELRTTERLAEPGGNVHYERFIDEILPNLRTGQGFKYRSFDCSRMEYSPVLNEVRPSLWHIVEGVYSHQPVLGNYMDVRVFMDISPKEQQSRIENRNAPKIAARYLNEWIPMEEAYFDTFNIHKAADVVVD